MRIAIASGKGGTGKTLVSTNLAQLLAERGQSVRYVDADVEAPNGHLFLHPTELMAQAFTVLVPELKTETCRGSSCGICQKTCQFNAILALPKKIMLLPELCHSCGACVLACPDRALREIPRAIGELRWGQSGAIEFWDATLNIGEAQATPLIRGLLQASGKNPSADITLIDAPPGTSCSAVAVVDKADQVILVTEPTPFGLHDLDLAVKMCREVGRPVSVIINRADLGNDAVRDYVHKEQLPVLAEIPFLRDIASQYADGALAMHEVPVLHQALETVAESLFVAHSESNTKSPRQSSRVQP